MDRITFPIIEVKDNQIVEKNGKISYFFELNPPDLTSKTNSEISSFIDQLGAKLNTFSDKIFFKFYRWKDRIYLSCNLSEIHLPQIKITPCNNPLEVFFGDVDIYSNVCFGDDYVNFNGRYKRILSVSEFGSDPIDFNFMPDEVDYVLLFQKKSKETTLREMERVRTSHQASFLKTKRDVESEGAYMQAEDIISEVTSGSESLYKMELYFVVEDLFLEGLNQRSIKLIEQLQVKRTKLFIEGQTLRKLKTGLPYIFNQLIPGVNPTFSLRSHTDKTSHLRFLMPLHQSHLMDSGIEFLDDEGNVIYFNPFLDSLKNKNILVTGSSGGGKSVFVNKLVHHLIKDHPTVILDKGGSFKRLTLYHDGVNLDQKINPMQFRNPEFLREIILCAVDKDRFNKLERGRLIKSIREHLVDPELKSFWELIKRLEAEFNGISLYFEDFKDVFGEEEINFSKILYVNIEDYSKEAVTPLILFLLEYFKSIAAKEKILIFDECWSFLKSHADYIDDCFRTFRKTGALPIAISQGLKDFFEIGELYNSISNNSYFKIFFPQDFISDPNIDEFDNQMINTLHFEKGYFSECYLKSSDNKYRKSMRIALSDLELELFHTEAGADDPLINFFNNNRQYFASNKEAIDAFVRLKHA